MRKFLAIGLIVFLLLSGCIGFKTMDDCTVPKPGKPPLRDSEKIACYHLAAVSAAHAEKIGTAKQICQNIYNEIGVKNQGNDISKKAETEKNLCLYDIAKVIARIPVDRGGGMIAANESCNLIEQNPYNVGLTGAPITKKICWSEVKKISGIQPERYYEGRMNICSIIFILPLFIIAAFWKLRA